MSGREDLQPPNGTAIRRRWYSALGYCTRIGESGGRVCSWAETRYNPWNIQELTWKSSSPPVWDSDVWLKMAETD